MSGEPGEQHAPRRRDTFAALSEGGFRLFAAVHLLAITALWGTRVVVDWTVLERTGSPVQVGIVASLQFVPMLCFGFLGGVVSDAVSKKVVLLLSNVVLGAGAVALGAAVTTGRDQLIHLYAFSLLLGLVTIVDNPARQVVAGELVPERKLASAITMNSMAFQAGALSGPMAAGALLATVGVGGALIATGAAWLTTAASITLIRPVRAKWRHAKPVRRVAHVLGGFAYVWSRSYLTWALVMTLLMSVLARSMPVILTDYANRIHDTGASGYAAMNTLLAVGGLVGILTLALFRTGRLRGIVVALLAIGCCHLLGAMAPTASIFLVVVACVGASHFIFGTVVNTFVQTRTAPELRGRVLSIMTSLFMGGQALGGPLAGAVTEHFGGRVAFLATGCALVVAAVVCGAAIGLSKGTFPAAPPLVVQAGADLVSDDVDLVGAQMRAQRQTKKSVARTLRPGQAAGSVSELPIHRLQMHGRGIERIAINSVRQEVSGKRISSIMLDDVVPPRMKEARPLSRQVGQSGEALAIAVGLSAAHRQRRVQIRELRAQDGCLQLVHLLVMAFPLVMQAEGPLRAEVPPT